jgi:hypothetical protein
MITDKQDIGAREVKNLLLNVYNRYRRGAIKEAQATKEAYLLNSILKAIELTDLEHRITALEEGQNRGRGSRQPITGMEIR